MKNVILCMLMVFATSVSVMAQKQAIYDRSSIKCMGVELDGSQTLRVLGYGRNRSDAKEQAMKNAVWAVVFDGIREGVSGCNMRPLVTEVNARERYEDYFNVFLQMEESIKNMLLLEILKNVLLIKARIR